MWQGQNGPICTLRFVDGLVIVGADLYEISHVKSRQSTTFKTKYLGDLHYFIRIKVIRTPDDILISQRHYVLNMLLKFGMTDCRSIESTPLARNVKLHHNSASTCDKTRF